MEHSLVLRDKIDQKFKVGSQPNVGPLIIDGIDQERNQDDGLSAEIKISFDGGRDMSDGSVDSFPQKLKYLLMGIETNLIGQMGQ